MKIYLSQFLWRIYKLNNSKWNKQKLTCFEKWVWNTSQEWKFLTQIFLTKSIFLINIKTKHKHKEITTTGHGVWLTVEWTSRCRFPRGKVERGSLKYPSLLGSYRLVSGINNESSKLVYHNKLWVNDYLGAFTAFPFREVVSEGRHQTIT